MSGFASRACCEPGSTEMLGCGKWLSGEGRFTRRLGQSVCSASLGAPLMWVAWGPAFGRRCGGEPGVRGPVFPIRRSSARPVCVSSPPDPPQSSCLDSYGVGCSVTE